MATLSKEQLDELVARVTANVLKEMQAHEAASQGAELRIPLGNAHLKPGDEVLWAPWTVAMPPSAEQLQAAAKKAR
jgi:hypothetical protein